MNSFQNLFFVDQRFVRRSGGREVPDAASRDHFRRKTWKAERRKDASPQDRKRQQVSRISSHQGF